jgi:hypothetical protein
MVKRRFSSRLANDEITTRGNNVLTSVESTMLGASLGLLIEGTHSDPCQSGFWIHNALAHTEGVSAMFCRKSKVLRVSK